MDKDKSVFDKPETINIFSNAKIKSLIKLIEDQLSYTEIQIMIERLKDK